MVAVTPNTRRILKIFDQTIFQIARFGFFLRIATTDVASSGSEVPIAIMVNPIVSSDNHNCFAISIAPFTIRFHHKISHVNHITMKRIDFFIGNVSMCSIVLSFSRFVSQNMYIMNIPNSNNNAIHSNLLNISTPPC